MPSLSYITLPDTSPHSPWPFFFPDTSFVYRAAPPAREPLTQGDLRAAMLHAADCLDASLDAQVDGDEAELLRNLETVRGYVAVVIEQISSSENLSTLQ